TSECSLLLAKAANENQQMQIGNQSGGRVFLFLYTDTFWETYERLKSQGVIFLESPRQESYGCVVVFQDLYGNKWDLLENKKPKS
ncbi:MAG: VOC family protein, partial [Runella zeae]